MTSMDDDDDDVVIIAVGTVPVSRLQTEALSGCKISGM